MICKNCSAYNDSRANFCSQCGGELYESTLVTSPLVDRVTPTSAPTAGIRAFSGIGNGYLQSAAIRMTNDITGQPRSDTYHSYKTQAKARPRSDGAWICPDCGELNGHEKLYCTGCGRYR